MRLLLVEDDPMMGRALKVALAQCGYAVDWTDSGEDAEEALATTTYDIMVLDINLPGKSGLEVAKDLRRHKNGIPVLALTARDATRHKVEGLNAGADDYLIKPFDLDELQARLQALIRRSHGRHTPLLEHGAITLDPAAKSVTRHGRQVELSAREFAVLSILMENAGKVLSKQSIEEKLYGWDIEIESNAVEVYVSHLRKKLDAGLIKTIRGLGYVVEKIA